MMHIKTDRAALADALTWVAQAIAKKPPSPSLGGIRMEAADGVVSLTAFDYEVSHTARVEADVLTAGECLVPGHFARTLVAGLRSADVELEHKSSGLAILGGRSAYTLPQLPIDEYPSIPSMPPAMGDLDAAYLVDALRVSTHAVDDGSPHETVRGLRLETAGDILNIVGMDRFRIGAVELAWPGSPFAATVPAKTFLAAAKGMHGAVTIAADENSVGLADANRTVVQRTFGPGFNTIWGQMLDAQPDAPGITVDLSDFLDAVKRAGTLGADVFSPIDISFGGEELRITVDVTDVGAGSDVIFGEASGKAEGLLSATYLADALGVMPGDEVRVSQTLHGQARMWRLDPVGHPHIKLALMGRRGKS